MTTFTLLNIAELQGIFTIDNVFLANSFLWQYSQFERFGGRGLGRHTVGRGTGGYPPKLKRQFGQGGLASFFFALWNIRKAPG